VFVGARPVEGVQQGREGWVVLRRARCLYLSYLTNMSERRDKGIVATTLTRQAINQLIVLRRQGDKVGLKVVHPIHLFLHIWTLSFSLSQGPEALY
jgi:hypothetical protein